METIKLNDWKVQIVTINDDFVLGKQTIIISNDNKCVFLFKLYDNHTIKMIYNRNTMEEFDIIPDEFKEITDAIIKVSKQAEIDAYNELNNTTQTWEQKMAKMADKRKGN